MWGRKCKKILEKKRITNFVKSSKIYLKIAYNMVVFEKLFNEVIKKMPKFNLTHLSSVPLYIN